MAAVKTNSKIGLESMVKEAFKQSRQRYTICTCVDSQAHSQHDEVPHVGLLFKAQPGGRSVKT